MTTKHTPGPWTTDEKDHNSPYQDIKIKAENHTVCTIWIDDAPVRDFNAEQEANARLIAAAPDLLTACWNVVQAADDTEHALAKSQAMAAIKKATGELNDY